MILASSSSQAFAGSCARHFDKMLPLHIWLVGLTKQVG